MYEEEHDTDYSKFADFNSIQLNDTHPVLGIPELIRILVDEKNLSWAEAIEITKNTFAFTNHTTLSWISAPSMRRTRCSRPAT